MMSRSSLDFIHKRIRNLEASIAELELLDPRSPSPLKRGERQRDGRTVEERLRLDRVTLARWRAKLGTQQ